MNVKHTDLRTLQARGSQEGEQIWGVQRASYRHVSACQRPDTVRYRCGRSPSPAIPSTRPSSCFEGKRLCRSVLVRYRKMSQPTSDSIKESLSAHHYLSRLCLGGCILVVAARSGMEILSTATVNVFNVLWISPSSSSPSGRASFHSSTETAVVWRTSCMSRGTIPNGHWQELHGLLILGISARSSCTTCR